VGEEDIEHYNQELDLVGQKGGSQEQDAYVQSCCKTSERKRMLPAHQTPPTSSLASKATTSQYPFFHSPESRTALRAARPAGPAPMIAIRFRPKRRELKNKVSAYIHGCLKLTVNFAVLAWNIHLRFDDVEVR
jgi:hypothetical protein